MYRHEAWSKWLAMIEVSPKADESNGGGNRIELENRTDRDESVGGPVQRNAKER